MQKEWKFEFLSLLFIVIFSALFIIPIFIKTGSYYQFYLSNFISILLFLTFTKWIFLLPFTPFSRMKWFKFLFIFLPIPLFLYQIDGLYDFQRYIDEEGTISFLKGSQDLEDYNFGRFMKYQYIFFNVAALVSIALLPIRMIVSFWRTTNTRNQV